MTFREGSEVQTYACPQRDILEATKAAVGCGGGRKAAEVGTSLRHCPQVILPHSHPLEKSQYVSKEYSNYRAGVVCLRAAALLCPMASKVPTDPEWPHGGARQPPFIHPTIMRVPHNITTNVGFWASFVYNGADARGLGSVGATCLVQRRARGRHNGRHPRQ
jgi:hypothetical protein